MTFYYFQCRHCATWAVTIKESGSHVKCNGCGGLKAYKYWAHGDSQDVIDRCEQYGVAHLPLPQPTKLNPCTRCGERFPLYALRTRLGSLICRDCYQAEDHPALTLPTPAEIDAHLAAQPSAEREALARQEAAYAALESSTTGE